jgi:NADH dehydrogenase
MAVPRIVIAGGGFGGVYAARALERVLRPGEAEFCLVNRENYFVFQPLLPEVISGSIGLLDTVSPIRRLCPRTNLYVREVERIDLERRVVVLAPGLRRRALELTYDFLVLAPGTLTDLSGMPGLAEHALSFRTLGDALRLRNRALEAIEEAANETDSDFRRSLLTFVVAGGGFSGVEVIAELNDFLRGAVRHFPSIRREEIHCVLVHSGDRILPEMAPGLAKYAQKILTRRGVTLKLKARVKAATADSVILNTGETIPARTLVSTAPAGATPLIASLDCAKEKGRLLVNASLELEGHVGCVWALGDGASIRMAGGEAAPPTAQHATREAELVAQNIAAVMRGGVQKTFQFGGLGKLGSLGHHSAVAEVFGFKISGFPAWLLWRSVYFAKMPGLDRKFRVGLDWLTALIFPADLVQLRVQTSGNITYEHFEAGEAVFQQGDAGDRLYVIRKGRVEVLRDGVSVAVLGQGESFGEMALLNSAPRNATVRALEPTDAMAIAKGDLAKLLANFPALHSGLTQLAGSRAQSP